MPRQHIYSETDIPECRICLESEEEEKGELISPCVCAGSQKYIHRSCLNRWRDGNRDGPAFTNCELCKYEYIIKRDFELETWIFPIKNITKTALVIAYCAYLYAISFMLWQMDYRLGYPSLIIPCLEDKESQLCQSTPSTDAMVNIIYYMSWASLLTSIIFFIVTTGKSFYAIHRKRVYWKHMFPQFILHMTASANIFIIYILYSLFNNIHLYNIFLFVITIHNVLFLRNYGRIHNKTITKMNTVLNKDRVLSLEDSRENIIV